jgi:energy-coupling factor transport system ATP-binding protein
MRIVFDKVCYTYSSLVTESRVALNEISFTIKPGELIAIVGASGSGKTTLIQQINGLLRPSQGHIIIGDTDVTDARTDLHMIRRQVGIVFQFPEIQLFEETVNEDVAFGPKNTGWERDQISRHVKRALEMVGLDPQFYSDIHPYHLSGGEKRRVAIAGVLAMNPSVLVLDEPTAGMDWPGTQKIESIIRLYHETGRTVLFVSHDMDLVARLAQRVLVLHQGKILYDGSKTALFMNEPLLKKAGLRLPQIVSTLNILRNRGFQIRQDIFSIQDARSEIRKLDLSSFPDTDKLLDIT